MNQKILVTICNYNHSKYLAQSIESIQNQTYENLDICVVDDGSDDLDTVLDIVNSKSKSDKRVRFINLEKNYGKWHALNRSIESTSAKICTSHDADDVSLKQRIELQHRILVETRTVHNLCGFIHCWNEEDVQKNVNKHILKNSLNVIDAKSCNELVLAGWQHPSINHYYTGEVETAGVSAMFYKSVFDFGIRFHPPSIGIRTLLSEDSDFNFRVTALLSNTSILAEKLYLYRRNTSTNQELL